MTWDDFVNAVVVKFGQETYMVGHMAEWSLPYAEVIAVYHRDHIVLTGICFSGSGRRVDQVISPDDVDSAVALLHSFNGRRRHDV